eukprot:COSAG04_NODE_9425_length_865_cov_4.533943_1_plen_100_part_00
MPMKWNGRPIHQAAVTKLLWTDASDFAWGGVLYQGNLRAVNAEKPGVVKGLRAHGELTAEHRQDSITVNEMRAVIWSMLVEGSSVLRTRVGGWFQACIL